MNRTRLCASVISLSVILLRSLPMVVAQDCIWDGNIDDRWLGVGPGPGFATNWSCPGPDDRFPTVDDNVLIDGTVVADGPAVQSSNNMSLNTASLLSIHDSTVQMTGTLLFNQGQIIVGDMDTTGQAVLRVAGGALIQANISAEIILRESGILESALNDTPVAFGANHFINGEGEITARFENRNVITARDENSDGQATMTIRPTTGGAQALPRFNTGVIQSSDTGDLSITLHLNQENLDDPNDPGQLIADTGSINLNTSRIVGGSLDSINDGEFLANDGTLVFDGVALNAVLRKSNVSTGSLISIENRTFTNNGTVELEGSSVVLRFTTSETLDGNGEIHMLTENLGGVGSRIRSSPDIQGTIGLQQKIRGVGAIEADLVNNGQIIAVPEDGTILQLTGSPKINNRLIGAEAGATLQIRTTSVTQDDPNAHILADEGIIQLSGGSIIGGRIESNGAGHVTITGSGFLDNVTNNAPIDIPNGNNTLFIRGGLLINNDTITVDGVFRFDEDGAVSGTGEVVLPEPGLSSRFLVDDGVTVTQVATHTTRGEGQLVGQGRDDSTFINHGRLEGESAADPLEVRAIRLEGAGVLDDVMIGFVATHAPGTSTGIVPLEGSYETATTATIEIEIGGTTPGTEHDQLDSSGTVNLSTGTALDVVMLDLSNDYTPAAGDRFDIIVASANDIVGTFNNSELSFPEFGLGHFLTWQPIDYSDPRKVTLEIATTLPYDVDLDDDGDVDGFDFLLIQRTDPSLIPVWQYEYNRAALVSSAASTIPEPTSAALLGALVLVASFGRPSHLRFVHPS